MGMKMILAAGNFYLDTIVVRDYPDGASQQRNFTEKVVDWEGAGDWVTSMIIHGLCERGLLSVKEITKEAITEVLQEAPKVASRSVGYLSARE